MELNGAPAGPDQMRVLALTNYGHFTSMLVQDFAVRGLSLHLERLTRDCQQLFDVELDTDAVRHHVRHALAGDPGPVMVRVTVYDPALDLGTIGSDAKPSVLVTTRPARHGVSTPLRLQATRYQREIPTVKHVSVFGALMHRRRARRAGFDGAKEKRTGGAKEKRTAKVEIERREPGEIERREPGEGTVVPNPGERETTAAEHTWERGGPSLVLSDRFGYTFA